MAQTSLSAKTLDLDLTKEVDRISEWMRNTLANVLHKRGVVLGLSGGVDSSVCCALAVRALGTKRVFGILMPEHDSSHLSADRGELLARHVGVEYRLEHIGETLRAIGCYKWRDEAIQRLFPEYTPEWKLKIAIAGGAAGGVNFFKLVVQNPKGEIFEQRLPLKEYLQIVAFNFVASGVIFVSSSMFQAMGNTIPSLISSIARVLVIAIPVLMLAGTPGFALRWIWYISAGAVVLQLALNLLLLQREFAIRLQFEPIAYERA